MNPADPADFVSPSYRHIGESLVRELGKLMADPEMVSLAGGYPGPELFDREGLRAAADEALREMPVAALQYGPTDGLPGLREQVARLLGARGTRCSAGDVLVTGGSQQGFDLLVRTLLRAGDAAVVERPTYTGPLRVLKVAGACSDASISSIWARASASSVLSRRVMMWPFSCCRLAISQRGVSGTVSNNTRKITAGIAITPNIHRHAVSSGRLTLMMKFDR